MDILGPALNGAFVLLMTLVLTWYIRDRFTDVDRKFDEHRRDIDRRFAEFRQDVDRRFAETDRRFVELRADVVTIQSQMAAIQAQLVAIALAVGVQPRPNTA